MLVAAVTTLLGAVVVAAALLRDEPMTPRGAAGARPAWQGLPEPADLARTSFPQALAGYDPASVDVHFERMLRAYEDLWAVASPELRERARMRAASRSGAPPEQAETHARDDDVTAVAVPEPPDLGETDADALAAEAALARVETDEDGGGRA
ncbi:MAG TPA: hypothetical protein VNU01_01255 [Egibacteraceae bacterium]|nr:hypothetical protein [Egibacteraceae bacterium]